MRILQPLTDATIAGLPVPSRRVRYYCGQLVTLIVGPASERYFTMYVAVETNEGWRKDVLYRLGDWPAVSVPLAHLRALYCRTLAAAVDGLQVSEIVLPVLETRRQAVQLAQQEAKRILRRRRTVQSREPVLPGRRFAPLTVQEIITLPWAKADATEG